LSVIGRGAAFFGSIVSSADVVSVGRGLDTVVSRLEVRAV
jgi:hypothetical protein